MITRLAERSLRTGFGTWREILYYDGQTESIALVYGDVSAREARFRVDYILRAYRPTFLIVSSAIVGSKWLSHRDTLKGMVTEC